MAAGGRAAICRHRRRFHSTTFAKYHPIINSATTENSEKSNSLPSSSSPSEETARRKGSSAAPKLLPPSYQAISSPPPRPPRWPPIGRIAASPPRFLDIKRPECFDDGGREREGEGERGSLARTQGGRGERAHPPSAPPFADFDIKSQRGRERGSGRGPGRERQVGVGARDGRSEVGKKESPASNNELLTSLDHPGRQAAVKQGGIIAHPLLCLPSFLPARIPVRCVTARRAGRQAGQAGEQRADGAPKAVGGENVALERARPERGRNADHFEAR